MEKKLRAGFSKCLLTPDYEVSLAGYGDDVRRRSQGVASDIYMTCVAVASGEKTVLLLTADALSVGPGTGLEIKEAVSKATGIPDTQVFICATHSHSCPLLYAGAPNSLEYRAHFYEKAVEAAQKALADLAPATMETAKERVPMKTFVRHYLMQDGTYAGPNFGNLKKGYVRHATEADETLILVKFCREGKQDILLVNWQAHPANARFIGFHLISADFVGVMRDKLQSHTGCLVAYYGGASGNQICMGYLPEEKQGLSWFEYGNRMADYAYRLTYALQPCEGTEISCVRYMFPAKMDHSWDHMLPQANEVYNLWHTVGKPEADALGKTYGFTSCYQSAHIRAKAARGEKEDLEMNALRIGPVGFITGTYEMFSTTGIYARKHSPFDTTVIMCGNSDYIPCREAYEYRSYEGDVAHHAPGTAEAMAEKYVELLHQVK